MKKNAIKVILLLLSPVLLLPIGKISTIPGLILGALLTRKTCNNGEFLCGLGEGIIAWLILAFILTYIFTGILYLLSAKQEKMGTRIITLILLLLYHSFVFVSIIFYLRSKS